MSPFDKLKVDPKLACEFLGVFARFEYALKVAGFASGGQHGVQPAWDKFAQSIDDAFDPSATPELQGAVDYLLRKPPKKQVLVMNHIEFQEAPADPKLPRAQRVLLMVRQVRNNLFHGGKFLSAGDEQDGRDQLLVKHSITVLLACLPLNESVQAMYEN